MHLANIAAGARTVTSDASKASIAKAHVLTNVTSVHNLANQVPQVLPRHLRDRKADRQLVLQGRAVGCKRGKRTAVHRCRLRQYPNPQHLLPPGLRVASRRQPPPGRSAHPAGVVQVVGGQLAAAEQVAQVEGVPHVPADAAPRPRLIAHAKLLALQQCGMEEGQGKEDGPAGRGARERRRHRAWIFEAMAANHRPADKCNRGLAALQRLSGRWWRVASVSAEL